jgi:hypothetical protein
MHNDANWLHRLMIDTLRTYAAKTPADYLRNKYAGLSSETIAQTYIRQQARTAALAGAAATIIVSITTILAGFEILSAVGIPALALTLPVGIIAFGLELWYTLRLQLKTAYDLCNLHGVTVHPDNPDDIQEIFAIGMGIRVGTFGGNVLQHVAPTLAKQQARTLLEASLIGRPMQQWMMRNVSRQLARRYLAEGLLLKAIVPGLSILLGAGWNYFSTIGIGRAVEQRTRLRRFIVEHIARLPLSPSVAPELVLATAFHTALSDGQVEESERVAYKHLVARVQSQYPDVVVQTSSSLWSNRETWLTTLATVDDEHAQQTLAAIARTMVVVNGHIGRAERKLLQHLATLFAQEYHEKSLRSEADRYFIKPPGHNCRVAATAIAFSLLLVVCSCSMFGIWTARQMLQNIPAP